MPVQTGQFLELRKDVVQELIGSSAKRFLAQTDEVFRDIVLQPARVMGDREAGIGRNLKWIETYTGAFAGVFEGAAATTPAYATLGGDPGVTVSSRILRQTLQQASPDPLRSAMQNFYQIEGDMYAIDSNLPIPLALLRQDALSANIATQLADLFNGFARHLDHKIAFSWYADREKRFKLSDIGTGFTTDNSAKTVTFSPPNGAAARYGDAGVAVEIRTSANAVRSGNANDPAIGFVQSVDIFENKVTLVFEETTVGGASTTFATWAANIASTDYVVLSKQISGDGATFDGLYGWRDWLKWGGATDADKRLLGSAASATRFIDVTDHTQFKSFHSSNFGPATETSLLRAFETARRGLRRYGNTIDTLIAAPGIWLRTFSGRQAFSEIDRTNRPGALTGLGLTEGFEIQTAMGRVRGFTSDFLESGVVLGIRGGPNWSIMTLPQPAGVRRGDGRLNPNAKIPLDFWAPAVTGTDSILLPLPTGTGSSFYKAAQIPGEIIMQMRPTVQIPGMVLEGVTDNVLLASV